MESESWYHMAPLINQNGGLPAGRSENIKKGGIWQAILCSKGAASNARHAANSRHHFKIPEVHTLTPNTQHRYRRVLNGIRSLNYQTAFSVLQWLGSQLSNILISCEIWQQSCCGRVPLGKIISVNYASGRHPASYGGCPDIETSRLEWSRG